MRSYFTRVFFIIVLLTLQYSSRAQTYQLVWADEFNGSIGSDWVFETGGNGWGNHEKEYYQPQNASVSNGNLVITARKESVGGMPYTSARMITSGKKSFQYGKIEARIKVPKGQGLWPAFWMLGQNISDPNFAWPKCGEIDIMEQVNTVETNYGTIHWDNNGHVSYGGNTPASGADFHVFSITWDASAITWFVDGLQYHQASILNSVNSTEEFHKPFFILLNLAVAGDWPGQTVDESKLPAQMLVDYVRVYQVTAGPPTCSGTYTTVPATIQAESYCTSNGVQLESTTDAGGGQNVGFIDTNDWMGYRINVPTAGNYKIQYRIASQSGGGSIRFERLGGSPVFGTISVPATGGWQTWQTISHNVDLPAGQQEVAITAAAGGFNVNWFSITPNSTTGVPIGQTIWLKGSNGLYASSENGTQAMRCNRTSVQAWEQFTVVDAGGGKIALTSQSKYVSSENGTQAMNCNRATVGDWEKFDWVVNGNGTISLRGSNAKYVSSENGTQAMTCNRTTVGGWEQFTWGTGTGGRTAMESVNHQTSEETDGLLTVYPNPSSGMVTIRVAKPSQIKILDASGRIFHSAHVDESMTMERMTPGLYIVHLQNSQQNRTTKLVIK